MNLRKVLPHLFWIAVLYAIGMAFTVNPAKAQFSPDGLRSGIPIEEIFFDEPAPAESLEELLEQMYLAEGKLALANFELPTKRAELTLKQNELAELELDLAALERLGLRAQEVVPEDEDPLELAVSGLKADIQVLEREIDELEKAEGALAAIDAKIVQVAAEVVKADIVADIDDVIAAAEVEILEEIRDARLNELVAQHAVLMAFALKAIEDSQTNSSNRLYGTPEMAEVRELIAAAEACEELPDIAGAEVGDTDGCDEIFREGQYAVDGWRN